MAWEIRTGHTLDLLRAMPAWSVQCCVTSPPYWGLRDYKAEPQVWGGAQVCEHRWDDEEFVAGPSQVQGSISARAGRNNVEAQKAKGRSQGAWCSACGAWLGALGLEPTPDLFVAHLVEIFREVRRVLRDDGTCWLNLGDSYSQDTKWGGSSSNKNELKQGYARPQRRGNSGLKPKDLVGIPWMAAFALSADGWYLRSDIVWAKGISFCETYSGSTMPESVTDRPTKGHEYVFLLTKSPDYYYDAEAIKERGRIEAGTRAAKGSGTREGNRRGNTASYSDSADQTLRNDLDRNAVKGGGLAWLPNADGYATYDGKRNVRTVWAISPRGFDGEFCTACRRYFDGPDKKAINVVAGNVNGKMSRGSEIGVRSTPKGGLAGNVSSLDTFPAEEQVRERRVCPCGRDDAWLSHFATFPDDLVIPMIKAGAAEGQTVLDPFSGAGTTAMVAQRLGRDAIGLELNADYADMSRERIRGDAPLVNVGDEVVAPAAAHDDDGVVTEERALWDQ